MLLCLPNPYTYQVLSKIGDSFVIGGNKIVSQVKNRQIVHLTQVPGQCITCQLLQLNEEIQYLALGGSAHIHEGWVAFLQVKGESLELVDIQPTEF